MCGQQRPAMALVLVDLRKLGLKVFHLALQDFPVLRQCAQKALQLRCGIAWRLVEIQYFADLVESEP
ncbi:hypothetical protein D3C81_2020070 [compost metagenome]